MHRLQNTVSLSSQSTTLRSRCFQKLTQWMCQLERSESKSSWIWKASIKASLSSSNHQIYIYILFIQETLKNTSFLLSKWLDKSVFFSKTIRFLSSSNKRWEMRKYSPFILSMVFHWFDQSCSLSLLIFFVFLPQTVKYRRNLPVYDAILIDVVSDQLNFAYLCNDRTRLRMARWCFIWTVRKILFTSEVELFTCLSFYTLIWSKIHRIIKSTWHAKYLTYYSSCWWSNTSFVWFKFRSTKDHWYIHQINSSWKCFSSH